MYIADPNVTTEVDAKKQATAFPPNFVHSLDATHMMLTALECRANNLPGWTQGGSSADPIVGQFAMLYHNEAAALGIDLNELYSAMLADAEQNPPEWNTRGRQVNVYKQYGFVPFGVLDTQSVGRQTREGSRTLEV